MAEESNETNLRLSYTWTFTDFAAGARASAQGRIPFWRVWFRKGVSSLLLILGIMALVDSIRKGEEFTWTHQGLAGFVVLGALWFILGRKWWQNRRLRRAFESSGEGGSAFQWTVNSRDVVIERITPRPEVLDELEWTDVARVVETDDGWLLHVDSRNYYWLPRQAVPEGQVAEFVHLARRGALRYGTRSETFLG